MFDSPVELVFNAKMIADVGSVEDRFFAVNYNVKTKEVAIFEGKTKSNPAGRRFLSRQLLKDPQTGLPYDTFSFGVGKRIAASGVHFEFIDAPEFTLRFMEANTSKFQYTDVDECVEALKRNEESIGPVFENLDPAGFGHVQEDKAKESLFTLHPALPKQAVLTLIRRFSRDGRFYYRYVLDYGDVCLKTNPEAF